MEDAGEVLDASRSLSDDELPAVGSSLYLIKYRVTDISWPVQP